ncbi:hypothetical protein [Gillisia sp. JM1]|uniref:hypothetical protein n=1 Tax=Gillisia sp. JM1 TaxID=1283286 RepID=UPI0004051C65|nr:hypothetical protein [Gillisia sp. JM1]
MIDSITHGSIRELLELRDNDKLEIKIINWWLLKYSDFYRQIEKDYKNNFISLDKDQLLFENFYSALDTICSFHKYENYFSKEIDRLKGLNRKDLENWIVKNERLGSEIFVCFGLDYLDYCENPIDLNIFIPKFRNQILVDREEFKNTIEFLDIFNTVYWK